VNCGKQCTAVKRSKCGGQRERERERGEIDLVGVEPSIKSEKQLELIIL
jgi:hypothetical protein